MNEIDKILEKAQNDDDIQKEIQNDISKMEQKDYIEEKSDSSVIESLQNENKTLNAKVKSLINRRKQDENRFNSQNIGAYNRMLTDYEAMQVNYQITFPKEDHPIFTRFNELANKYPSRKFIVDELDIRIMEKEQAIEFDIQELENNKKQIEAYNEYKAKFPDKWEDFVTEEMKYYNSVTSIPQIEKKIEDLQKSKNEIRKWFKIKNNIYKKPNEAENEIEVKNNLYYEIMNEFDRIFEFCSNVRSISQYKAYIVVNSFTKDDLHSALCRELEKQVGLCEEPYTHTFFYSNGEGRLVPYELNRQFLQYVNNNTTFIKYSKNAQYKSGDIINSKVLFDDIPLFCNKLQYRNPNLVGFNNCFYDVENNKIVPLNPQAPILPLKNTKTELYLDEEIEDNPMKKIFEECFTEQDAKTILAYIGTALYDKGYTQRQESLFLMGRGGTGKSTFTKAICSIFYNIGHQLVTKFKDSNEFGLSVFTNNDVIIVDEIQSAPNEFANKMKNISSSDALPVEKKHFDTINIPAENIPRMFLIGNNFSKKLYQESDNEGVSRRILIVIPTQPIQNLGYQWKDLITDSCKQWLVQEATKEYIAQGLHKKSIPINSISEAEKKARLDMCTYPEQFFIKKHLQVAYNDDGKIDTTELVEYEKVFDFVRDCIDKKMVEATCKKTASNMFIGELKTALNITEGFITRTINGVIYFKGIVPKTEEAIEFFDNWVEETE